MDILLENGSSKAVIRDKGAELRSLRIGGKELMWGADPAFWGKTSPILFPMIGNLRGGKTLINGTEYAITKHGFARDNTFSFFMAEKNCAVFEFSADDTTKKSFPFDFELRLNYTLYAESLEIKYSVTNKSDTAMPFCIGAHPAFACPAEEGSEFSDHSIVFEKPETVNSPVMNLETRMWGDKDRISRLNGECEFRLAYPLFDNDCVYFDTISSKSVKLISRKTGKGVRVAWTGFETLGVWTPDHKNAPFVCIEPWCGCDDYDTDDGVFEHKRGIQLAAPGETKRYSMTVSAI